MKRTGFTLAEVLITLTIIGVIAALTIPNLMQSYRKHQVESSLKEAYSILSNAYTMAKAEYGEFDDIMKDTYTNGPNSENSYLIYFGKKYFEPYIKFTKKCDWRQSNCKIFTDAELKAMNDTWSGGSNGLWQTGEFQSYALANGMYLGISDYAWHKTLRFIFDINGGNGPNRYGHDIFAFIVNEDHKLVAGTSWESATWNIPNYYDCSETGTNCSIVIMKNGWRIPDDYPIKKW